MRWKRKKKRGERDIEKEKPQVLKKNIDRLTQKATLPNLTRETPKRKRKMRKSKIGKNDEIMLFCRYF